MDLSSLQVLLLAVVAITLSAQAAESAIAAPPLCAAADVGKGFCLNCKTKAKCEGSGVAPVAKGTCTVAGEACTVLNGVATCRPFANTACTCAKPAQCDAYDPNSVLACLSGGTTVSTKCSATKTCVNGACVTPATTTSTASPSLLCVGAPDGYVVSKPSCTTAFYCSGGASLGPTVCPSGSYFDISEIDCKPIPPVPCAGCGSGACPDKSDCSKWYICDGGAVVDDETCDADTPVFDIVANECLATGTCTANVNCTYVSTTTAATTTTTVSTSTTTTLSTSTTTPVSSTPTTTVSTSTTTPVSSSTTTPVSSPPSPTVSSSTTTPVSSSTTTPVSSSTTTPVSSSTTTPVSSSTTTTVSSSTTTPVSSSTTTPVSSSTTTPVSSSTTTPVSSSTTTTSRPATCTAANVGRRYPYAGTCKKYWSCRLVATGVYSYVESTCLGDLVYNAATGYCDTQANVPSCVIGK